LNVPWVCISFGALCDENNLLQIHASVKNRRGEKKKRKKKKRVVGLLLRDLLFQTDPSV